MPSREVMGVLLPVKVAHHPALELLNTRAWWGSDAPKEYLLSWTHVATLANDLGLVREPSAGDDAALSQVLDLRADLYAVITGIASAGRIARLDAVIRAGRRDLEFRGLADGVPLWLPRSAGAPAVLHAFGRSIGDLLARPQRIGVCPRCGWAFLDPSGRRKWCSMKWCGNRDKVQQFALRAKGAGGAGPA